MNTTHFCKLSLLTAAISSTIPILSYAQDNSAALNTPVLEEVVVTARKRSENLQDVPLAVTAMDSRELAISGAADISDIQAQVPGLTAYAARGTSSTLTAYIRGVGQSDPLWGVEPGVGLYLDDVYIARPQGALLEVFDVDRIEVLRGPQGTLYGRNTIGGAIKYVSKPVSFETEGKLQVALGNYDRQDLVASYNTALVDDVLAAKISIASLQHDGLGKNNTTGADVSDKQVLSGRIALDWHANPNLIARLALDATKDTSAPRGGQRMMENPWEATIPVMQSGLVAPLIPGLPFYSADAVDAAVAANGISPLSVSDDRYDTDSGLEGSRNDVNTSGASLTLEYDINNNWSFKSVSAYRQGDTEGTIDFDMGPLPIADVYGEYDDHQFTQELQFNFDNGEDWQAVFGLYYIDATAGGTVKNKFLLAPVLPAGHPDNPFPVAITTVLPQYTTSEGDIVTESYSLYGETSWQMTEKLSLTLGGRYNWEKKTANIIAENFADDQFTTVSYTETDFDGDETWTNFSPKVSLDYQLSDEALLYASISEGFKSGGFNIRAKQASNPESVQPYDEETVTSYEIGVKTTLFNRLMLNAAYFYSDYEDIQLSIFSQSSDGTFFGDFTNAGQGVIQGVEMEFAAALTESFSISGNLAYLDAEYKEYLDGGVDIADQQEFTNTPRWTYTFNATYDHTLQSGAGITARLSYSYRDDIIPTTDLSPIIEQEAYDTVDATLAYTTADEHWRFAIEGRNLTDEEYRTTGYDLRSSGAPIVEGFYGAPRTVAIKASYGF